MDTVIRKRGRRTPLAPQGYLRYVEAAKLFEPLDQSSFAYRARTGDIESIESEGIKAYKIESIVKVRDAILKETAVRQKETPVQEKPASDLEKRVATLEKEVKRLRNKVDYLEKQLSESS